MTVHRMILLLFLCVLSESKVFAADERETQASYSDALQSMKLQKYKEASRQLKAILQKDPKDKEALLLLGTVYYQNHSFRKARAYFERSDASALSSETAFAWGSVYFHFEDYKKAAQGYRYVVKSKAPFRSFSIYYLGVCYYKMGQWSRARRFFQSVDPGDLPQFMQNNRKAYLAEIRQKQDRLLANVLGSNPTQSLRQPSVVEQFEATLAKEKEREKDANLMSEEEFETPRIDIRIPDRLETPKGFVSSWRPSLQLMQESSSLDNFNLNQDSVTLVAHREAVETTMGYNQNSWNTYLRLQAGSQSYDATIQESQFFQLEQTTGIFASESDRRQKLDSSFGHLEVAGSSNLGQYFRLELSAGYLALLPRYDSKLMWGDASAQAQLSFTASEFEANLQLEAHMPFDQADNKSTQDFVVHTEAEKVLGDFRLGLTAFQWMTQDETYVSRDRYRYALLDPELRYRVGYLSELGGSGSLSYNWGESTLSLKGSATQRTSKDGKAIARLSRLDEIESVALGLTQVSFTAQFPLWDSFSLSGSGAVQQLTSYLYNDYDESGNLLKSYESDVQQSLFQIGISMPLTNWLTFSGRYHLTSQEYSGADVADKEFRRRNPDLTQASLLLLDVGQTF